MLRAVIFDFDGVITDSEILHFRAFNAVLSPHGLQLTKTEYYQNYLGMSDADCFRALIAEGQLRVPPARVTDVPPTRGVEGIPRVAAVPSARVEGVPPSHRGPEALGTRGQDARDAIIRQAFRP